MLKLLQTPVAQAVVWISVCLVLALLGFYLICKMRDQKDNNDTITDHLANFRQMYAQGVLADEEFRTIKTTLGRKLRSEIIGLGKDVESEAKEGGKDR